MGIAVIVVVVLVVVRLGTSGSNPSVVATNNGHHPQSASAAYVKAITTIPLSVYDAVRTDNQPVPFTVTKEQPSLTSSGLPRFIYEGGEFCPYCAMMRYSLVAALSRFGSFSGLKATSSGGSGDGNIPTFSFLGSSYKSHYLVFTPYEAEDREEPPQLLQAVPSDVASLIAKYDGTGDVPAKPFNPGSSSGIPFLDIGNRYVSSGDPAPFVSLWQTGEPLNDGGPGRMAIADGIRNPMSPVGKTISGALFIAQANYITAAICSVNHESPFSVCTSPGVTAAAAQLRKARPLS